MATSLAHVESMREAYVQIVRQRLGNPSIKPKKKMSFGEIAKGLNLAGFSAPRGGPVTYKIVQRLSEIVGDVEPLPVQPLVRKVTGELQIGDCVTVIAPWKSTHGETGIIRKIAKDGSGFQVQMTPHSTNPKLLLFLVEEVEHQPDERHFYDPLSLAEEP